MHEFMLRMQSVVDYLVRYYDFLKENEILKLQEKVWKNHLERRYNEMKCDEKKTQKFGNWVTTMKWPQITRNAGKWTKTC